MYVHVKFLFQQPNVFRGESLKKGIISSYPRFSRFHVLTPLLKSIESQARVDFLS
jgi:hypothetical protein